MTPEQFLVLADPLPEPMLLLSGDGLILAGNRATGERLGLGPKEIQGRRLAELVVDPADEVAHYLQLCARSRPMVPGALVLRGGSDGDIACRTEGTLLRPRVGDSEAILLLRLTAKESAVGQFIALNQRIEQFNTERRHLEQQKAEQFHTARLLAAIVESSDDAILSKTLDGIIQSWNAAAERLFGYRAEQAIGRPISLIVPGERAGEEDRIIARLRAGERIDHFDTVRVRSDGQPIHVSMTISPIRDETGRIVGASNITRDISERLRIEAELREADRRKDEFLATLAHELRNPLAPIRNALQLLRLSGNNPAMLDQAQGMMERQLAQMVRLIDDLLDVSRISQGKLELRKEWVDLATVVRNAVETARPLIEAGNHQLSIALPSEPILLDADLTRLSQVIANLLNNAAKYSERGGRIELTVRCEDGEAMISVRDTGIGIPADQLPRIFEMFVQVDRSLEKSQGGLGIGLTLVKRLVEMHGGTVEAHSEGPGQGSEFVLRLPVVTVPAPEPREARSGEPCAPVVRCRILVVDDNQDSAESLGLMLRMMGHEVRTAHDGLAGVEAAASFRPDVVLLDLGMPRLNGYDACRRIRAQEGGQNVLLVALTGWGQDEDRRRTEEAGFDEHLVKPVDPAALEKVLAAGCSRS